MMLKRIPGPALRPFVKILWVTNQTHLARVPSPARERVLPTGEMHLAFRLSDPLRLFATEADRTGVVLGHAVIGGARSTFHLRDVSVPTWSVGVMLRPGASRALFGIPADEFAGLHVALEQVWGPTASLLLERLSEMRNAEQMHMARKAEAGEPDSCTDPGTPLKNQRPASLHGVQAVIGPRQSKVHDPRRLPWNVSQRPASGDMLDFIERELTSRVAGASGIHPVVALGLDRLRSDIDVRSVVQSSGYSHRRFVELFKRDVGVAPKPHCRLRRFQRVLTRITREPNATWADLALSTGFSDQSHLSREFREFAGLTPREYRRLARGSAHHVPLGERE